MPYQIFPTYLSDVLILKPTVWSDERGFFMESFNQRAFEQATGLNVNFVQDNHSQSKQHVLRGLHYQFQHPQGKLIRVIQGTIFDVAVDLRRSSPQFGQWVGVELSAENKQQLWIPEGFAHGFLVMSTSAQVLYKTTDYWYPEHERCLIWNDPNVNIGWPIQQAPLLAAKDIVGKRLLELELFF